MPFVFDFFLTDIRRNCDIYLCMCVNESDRFDMRIVANIKCILMLESLGLKMITAIILLITLRLY